MIEFGIGEALYTARISDQQPDGDFIAFTGPDGEQLYLAAPERVL